MENISRKDFLTQLITVGTVVGLSGKSTFTFGKMEEDDFYAKMVVANNQEVRSIIKALIT